MRNLVLFITALFLCQSMVLAQSNKLTGDGGMALGLSHALHSHRFSEGSSRQPLDFALNGSFIALDAHVGLGSGWKAGIYFNVANENLKDSAFADYILSTLDTSGYYVTRDAGESQYCTSRFYAVQLANDLKLGDWIITPQIALGIANANLSFNHSYYLKERGTNYWRKTDVINNLVSGIDLALKPGLKIGYSFNIHEDRCLIYASADYIRYRSTVGLNYRTEDVFGNSTQNTQWKRGLVSFMTFGVGATYYMIPDPMVVKNSDKTRRRNTKKSSNNAIPTGEEFD